MNYQSFSSPQKLFLAGILSFLFINLAQAQVPLYGTITGGNTINVTVPGNYGGTYYTGHSFIFLAVGSVTSGPVSISVNGATTRPLKKNVSLDLVSGDIVNGQAVPVIYDGTNFQIVKGENFISSTASGISTLNGLTSTSQNFSTSSTGTSVNIASSGSTHNFNIPLVTVVGGNNVTVSGGFPNYTISGLAGGTSTSQWVSTTGGIYYSGGNIGLKINPQYDLHLYNPTQGVYSRFETPLTTGTFSVLEFKTGIYNLDLTPTLSNAIWQMGIAQSGTTSNPIDRMYFGRSGLSSTDFAVYRDGNIGIGLPGGSVPSEKLSVLGNISASGIGYFSTIAGLALNGAAVGSIVTVDGIGRLGFGTLPSSSTSQWVSTTGGTIFYNGGNVGIGLANPNQALGINGNLSLDDAAAGSSPNRVIGFPTPGNGNHGTLTIQAKSNIVNGTAFTGGNLILAGGDYNYASSQLDGANGRVIIRGGRNVFGSYPNDGGSIIFQSGDPTNTGNYVERMRMQGGTGYLGLNTNNPSTQLDVNGNARFLGPVSITGLAGATTQALGVNNLGQLVTISGATSAITSINTLTTSSQTFSTSSTGTSVNINSSGSNHNFNIPLVTVVGGNNVTVSGGFPNYTISGLAGGTSTSQWTSTTGGSIYYGGTGYVGINSAIPPIAHLDVNGVALFRSQFFPWADGVNVIGPSGSGKGFIIHEGPNGTSSIGSTTGRYYLGMVGGSELSFIGNGLTTSILANNNNIAQMSTLSGGTFAVNGRIGVGTSSPATSLDVNGNARFLGLVTVGGLRINNLVGPGTVTVDGLGNLGLGALSSTSSSQWVTTTSGIYSPVNAAIGTAPDPTFNFKVAGNQIGVSPAQLILQGATDSNQQLMIGYNTQSSVAGGEWGSIQAIKQFTGAVPLVLQNYGGNVGIGTINPLARLTVNGNASISGITTIGGLNLRNLIGPGTVTVDGFGNLGVSTAGGGTLSGSGTANGVAFWSNGTTLTANGSNFTYTPSTKSLKVGNAILSSNSSSGNVFFGTNVGNQTMSGTDNNFFGSNTGQTNTVGHNNNFFGKGSGFKNVLGESNNFFGEEAGYSNQIGSYNNAMGYQAGYGNASGSGNNNNSFGQGTGFENEGDGNNFMGFFAGRGNTSGNYNNFFGQSAGLVNTTGSDNIFIGQMSGLNNSTGDNNIAIGKNAGFPVNGFNNSVAIGINATVGGSNLMALGGSGVDAVNVGIGTGLPQNTIDVVGGARIRNLSVSGAVFANASGDLYISTVSATNLWTVVGTNLEPVNTVYGINIPITNAYSIGGNKAVQLGPNGSSSVYLGGAGNSTITGLGTAARNVFIGQLAGYSGGAIGSNIFIGYESGFSTDGSCCFYGSRNTFIGESSGKTNTIGRYNTAIGYKADVDNGSYDKATAIGSFATVGGSNMMALGGAAGSGYQVSVGIGTGLPQNTIDVVGGARIRNLSVSGAVFANASGDLYINTASSANLWTVSGTSLTPSTSSYGLNIGTNITSTGLVNISSTTNSGLVVSSSNLPASTGAIMGYSYSSNTAGIAGFVNNSNAVGVFGTSSNSLSTGVEGSNNAGGTAIRASGTGSVNPLVTIDQNGTTGTGLRVNLGNGSNTATGLLISTSSPTSQAMDIAGKIQLRNYTNGTLTVDGLGNLGVSTSASSVGAGAGFMATSTTVQSGILHNTWTLVQFPIESFDDAGAFLNSLTYDYTVPSSGVYQINANVPFANIGQVDIAIVVGGTVYSIVNSTSTSPTTGIITSVPISGILKLTLNQKVTIQVRQFTGTSQSTAASNNGANASFSMVKLY